MIRYRLTNFIKKSLFTQFIISSLPIIMASFYILFYMYDLTGLIISFENNNRYISQDILSDVIKEVSNFEINTDGSYSVILSDDQSVEEEIGVGDVIFTISIINDSWYQLITKSGSRLSLTDCELFDVESLSNGNYKIIVGDSTFEVNSGDVICDVSLNENAEYVVSYIDENIEDVIPEYISSLQVVMKNNDKYKIRITSSYEKELDDISINFCTNLPTDSIYYNEVSQIFLKNVSSSFKIQFILGSNIFVAIISILLLTLLIKFIGNKEDIKYFKNNALYMANLFGVIILFTCLVFTLLVL